MLAHEIRKGMVLGLYNLWALLAYSKGSGDYFWPVWRGLRPILRPFGTKQVYFGPFWSVSRAISVPFKAPQGGQRAISDPFMRVAHIYLGLLGPLNGPGWVFIDREAREIIHLVASVCLSVRPSVTTIECSSQGAFKMVAYLICCCFDRLRHRGRSRF